MPIDSQLNDELKQLRIENEKLKGQNILQSDKYAVCEKSIKSKIAEAKQVVFE